MSECPFCEYAGPSPILHDFGDVIVFEPLGPVTQGHVLVVPKKHVRDAKEDWALTGRVFECASRYSVMRWYPSLNFITSVGKEATQTVNHLHVHLVPRREDDGLRLPWTPRTFATPEPFVLGPVTLCIAHMQPEPCDTCRAYIAAGL